MTIRDAKPVYSVAKMSAKDIITTIFQTYSGEMTDKYLLAHVFAIQTKPKMKL